MELKRLSLVNALGVVFSFALTAQTNAVLVEIVTDPPFNVDTIVPGHTSYTFRINLDMGESVTAFDATFTSATMHHELTGATVFEDLNGSIPGPRTGADDSQFEFLSSEFDVTFGDNEDDSPGLLEAVAARGAMPALTTDFNLAHIVIPTNAIGFYEIFLTGAGAPAAPFTGNFGAVPEASQVIAGGTLTLAALGTYFIRRRWKRAVPASC